MRKFYHLILLICSVFIIMISISSCSEKEDDISAPTITIKKPAENDTIHLEHSNVYIEVKLENNANIEKMLMTVTTQSGVLLYKYEEDQIDKPSYSCNEYFNNNTIYMISKVKLIVTCENEFHAWRKKEVNFYITR
jgi:hypothetical protein